MKPFISVVLIFMVNLLLGQNQDSTLLYFQIIPGQCELKIDGNKTQNTGKCMLSQGSHKIVLWKSGFELFDTTIVVSSANPITLKKRLKLREDYREFEKMSNRYQFKRLAINRGIPIMSGLCLGVSAYSILAARKNVKDGEKLFDQYQKAMGSSEIEYLKEKYEEEKRMNTVNRRNAIILGSIGAALGGASFYLVKKVKLTRPVYVDPGAVEFESASLNYGSFGLQCSINIRIN